MSEPRVLRGGYIVVERGAQHAWDPDTEYRGIDRLPVPPEQNASVRENDLWTTFWDAFYDGALSENRAACERLVRQAEQVGRLFEVLDYYALAGSTVAPDVAALMGAELSETDRSPDALESHPNFLGYDVSYPLPTFESVLILDLPAVAESFRHLLNAFGLLDTVKDASDIARRVSEVGSSPVRHVPIAVLAV